LEVMAEVTRKNMKELVKRNLGTLCLRLKIHRTDPCDSVVKFVSVQDIFDPLRTSVLNPTFLSVLFYKQLSFIFYHGIAVS
jgi:hypothetical protein